MLHFPDAMTMTASLTNHPLLSMDYYQEKGITKAVAELAAKRFANSAKVEMGVKMGAMTIICDLRAGVDGFSGEPLPNLGKIGLNEMVWRQITMATEKAIMDSAQRV